jgi:hypothetical protein
MEDVNNDLTVNMKKVVFRRLLKNDQMQGPRNPEAQRNINRSVLGGCTPQRRRMMETQRMGVFHVNLLRLSIVLG